MKKCRHQFSFTKNQKTEINFWFLSFKYLTIWDFILNSHFHTIRKQNGLCLNTCVICFGTWQIKPPHFFGCGESTPSIILQCSPKLQSSDYWPPCFGTVFLLNHHPNLFMKYSHFSPYEFLILLFSYTVPCNVMILEKHRAAFNKYIFTYNVVTRSLKYTLIPGLHNYCIKFEVWDWILLFSIFSILILLMLTKWELTEWEDEK